ncbi:hypothetical protein HDU76_001427 [Blyttiomyces sp. JEL0837]|nr:hypothetical protein HDU76_001427 [Blyttiomyces sp. JEL0837]
MTTTTTMVLLEQPYDIPPGWTFTRVFRPIRTTNRLIIPFIKANWVSHSHGIVGDDVKIPHELESRGVSQLQWDQLLESLWPAQKKNHTILTKALNYITLVGIPYEQNHEKGYDNAVEQWLDHVNDHIFKPAGVFAKLQTCISDEYCSHDGKTRNDHQECSWLAVALDDKESERLNWEPVFWIVGGEGKLVPATSQNGGRCV